MQLILFLPKGNNNLRDAIANLFDADYQQHKLAIGEIITYNLNEPLDKEGIEFLSQELK